VISAIKVMAIFYNDFPWCYYILVAYFLVIFY